MVRAKLDELLQALDFVSGVPDMGNEAFLSLERGTVHWRSEFGDVFEEPPEDLEDRRHYLQLPNKHDLGLGRRLAVRFAEEVAPNQVDTVREIFSRRGAYGRFKELLMRQGLLDQWHQFESAAEEWAIREWCNSNGVEVDG
jgi:hypothetical protein